ncbi:MAG: LPS export ABC transporter permease LptF [Arenimonas sp.]
MLLIERHLLRQFAETVVAVAIVLLLVTLGALFTDLIGEIAKGKVPAGLLLSQLGLRSIRFLTLVLPLALFLGLLLAIGRLYAESEMAVLAGVGLGPQRLWRPLLWVSLPVLLLVSLASLWLAPLSAHKAKDMIEVANRSFLIAGLEPGRFVELPGKAGVLYVTELSTDGTRFRELFVQREHEGRLDIVTANEGSLQLLGANQRYLRLRDGFRVEGALGAKDFRMMRFEQNDVRVPDREREESRDDLSADSTLSLMGAGTPLAKAELHWRFAMPLFVVALSLFALPLARSEPRQPQYGLVLFALLVYLVGMLMLLLGTGLIGNSSMPAWLGLWWVHVPLLALAAWLYSRDGRISAPAPATVAHT